MPFFPTQTDGALLPMSIVGSSATVDVVRNSVERLSLCR
jgi:hypothetical protein